MKIKLRYLMSLAMVFSMAACDDDEKPKTIPEVTTGAVTDITTTSAMVSGLITDNGNDAVTVSGFVYSSVVTVPTIADDKIEVTDGQDDIGALLEGLNSGTTYHVRAYATNSIGTGYGEVVQFMTGNSPPTAANVFITGDVQVDEELTAMYTYSDTEDDAESGSTFQWYVADDGTGAGEAVIAGATEQTFTIQEAQQGKFIRFGVTPKALTGNTTGTEVKSAFVGAVGDADTTVTFTYNGTEVTYGIITRAATGRKWLDRNLGAPNVPASVDDFSNYGDFFQWGRLDDGHQVISRSGSADANVTGVNGTTTTLATSDIPGHSQFIIGPTSSTTGGEGLDWLTPQNHSLWQGVDGKNNPCPDGWRIPTKEEWAAENITSVSDGFTKLNLTYTGYRVGSTGSFSSTATGGFYWSSSAGNDNQGNPELAMRIRFNSTSYNELATARSSGYACRCIKE